LGDRAGRDRARGREGRRGAVADRRIEGEAKGDPDHGARDGGDEVAPPADFDAYWASVK